MGDEERDDLLAEYRAGIGHNVPKSSHIPSYVWEPKEQDYSCNNSILDQKPFPVLFASFCPDSR